MKRQQYPDSSEAPPAIDASLLRPLGLTCSYLVNDRGEPMQKCTCSSHLQLLLVLHKLGTADHSHPALPLSALEAWCYAEFHLSIGVLLHFV